jgi:sirohydrochlorin cobaltochelatase
MTKPSRDLTAAIAAWIGEGPMHLGQVLIRRRAAGGYELCHHEDADRSDLALFTRAEDARHLSAGDDAGRFRPLKTAPNLRHGWRLHLPDAPALRGALDYFYPAMMGALFDWNRRALDPVPLRATLDRQSGMYAITRKITDAQAQEMIAGFCTSRGGCLKTILWPLEPGVPVTSLPPEKFDPRAVQPGIPAPALPMLCHEACNLLVARAREVVKGK